jgi:hypothetical protein
MSFKNLNLHQKVLKRKSKGLCIYNCCSQTYAAPSVSSFGRVPKMVPRGGASLQMVKEVEDPLEYKFSETVIDMSNRPNKYAFSKAQPS